MEDPEMATAAEVLSSAASIATACAACGGSSLHAYVKSTDPEAEGLDAYFLMPIVHVSHRQDDNGKTEAVDAIVLASPAYDLPGSIIKHTCDDMGTCLWRIPVQFIITVMDDVAAETHVNCVEADAAMRANAR